MRLRTPALLLAAALAVASHPTEGPGYHHPDEEVEIFFAESAAWFTASTPTGVGNVDHENGAFMGWSDAEPTSPVGGVTVATATSGFQSITDPEAHDRGQFTAEGEVTGYLDSITLDLFYVSPVADVCGMTLAVDLDIDGVPVLDMDGISGRVEVFTEPAGDGTAVRLKVTNIHALLDSYSSDSFDLVGDEETLHAVKVSAQQYPLCNEVVWRYDTAEFPASITFNRDPSDPSVASYTTFDVTSPPTPGA